MKKIHESDWFNVLIADDKARDLARNDARFRRCIDAIAIEECEGRDPRVAIRHVLTQLCADLRERDRKAIDAAMITPPIALKLCENCAQAFVPGTGPFTPPLIRGESA